MKKVSKFIFWTPRLISIIFISFLTLFSLDVFDSCNSVLSCFTGLLMHNIPVFILIIILLIAWKHEIVGAIAFILAGLAYIVLLITSQNFQWFMLAWSITIAGPAFLVGILFYVGRKRKSTHLKSKKL